MFHGGVRPFFFFLPGEAKVKFLFYYYSSFARYVIFFDCEGCVVVVVVVYHFGNVLKKPLYTLVRTSTYIFILMRTRAMIRRP